MKTPESLETLLDDGIIQEVVRPLMSGKEAQVFVVVAGGERCVAKVYKEAHQRTFKHRSSYTEGRRSRNSRDQRARSKRTQHGRKVDEAAWRTTEADMIYRLHAAGVRVPEPINFVDGVLVMELVRDAEGHAAPRLGDLTFSASEAIELHGRLIREVVRMLCAGVIHGDLSEFNVLMGRDGPVIIDFPQSVDPAHNANARELLLRDVQNLHRFLARFAPGRAVRPYGEEIWSLFHENRLKPDTELTGRYKAAEGKADTGEVMALIEDARREEAVRRGAGRRGGDDDASFEADDVRFDAGARAPKGAPARAAFCTVIDFAREAPAKRPLGSSAAVTTPSLAKSRRRRRAKQREEPARAALDRPAHDPKELVVAPKSAGPKRRRRRSGRGASAGASGETKREDGKSDGGMSPGGATTASRSASTRRVKDAPAAAGARTARKTPGAERDARRLETPGAERNSNRFETPGAEREPPPRKTPGTERKARRGRRRLRKANTSV